MTLKELKKLLNTLDVPCTYRMWGKGKAPKLPYIAYYENSDNTFKADNHVSFKSINVTIEFYSDKKELDHEEKTEEMFKDNKIVWESYEEYIEEQEMQVKYYEITI